MKIVLIMLSFATRYLFLSIHFLKHKVQVCRKGTRRGQISPTSTQANVFRESVHARGELFGVSKRDVSSLKMRSFTITVYETVYGLVFETPRNSRKVTALCIYATVVYTTPLVRI